MQTETWDPLNAILFTTTYLVAIMIKWTDPFIFLLIYKIKNIYLVRHKDIFSQDTTFYENYFTADISSAFLILDSA